MFVKPFSLAERFQSAYVTESEVKSPRSMVKLFSIEIFITLSFEIIIVTLQFVKLIP